MKLMKRAAFGLLALLTAGLAHAVPITFAFTGVVSQDPLLDPSDPSDPFGGSIAAGTLFSGSYTFESTTPDGDASASGGSYTSSPGSLSVTIGGNVFAAFDLLNIGVGNNFSGSDFYTVFAQDITGADTFDLSLTLQDTNGTAFVGAALLTDAPSFAAFELATLFLEGSFSGNQVQIQGDLASLTCTAGCEPGGGGGGGPGPAAAAGLKVSKIFTPEEFRSTGWAAPLRLPILIWRIAPVDGITHPRKVT